MRREFTQIEVAYARSLNLTPLLKQPARKRRQTVRTSIEFEGHELQDAIKDAVARP